MFEPYYRQMNMVGDLRRINDNPVIRRMPKPPQSVQPVQQTPVAQPSFNNTGATGGLAGLMKAIGQQESSGRYNLRNPDSGAMGKYQIMPSNIEGNRGWDYEALGRNISTEDFMNNPQIQEQIAQYKLNQYYNKYGAQGAAAAWYGGPGAVSRMNSTKRYGQYPSISEYIRQVLGRL